MIIVQFSGGVGNQMFQYTLYEYLRIKYPTATVKAGIRGYKRNGDRKFLLYDIFEGLDIDEASVVDVLRCVELPRESSQKKTIKKTMEIICAALSKKERKDLWWRVPYTTQEVECLNIDKYNYCLNGSWETEYFLNKIDKEYYEKKISDKLKFKDRRGENWFKDYENYETCGIHVRGGDFKFLENRNVLGNNYYPRAIEMMRSTISNPIFFVFTDEYEYAKKIIPNDKDIIFVGDELNEKSRNDLFLFSRCRNNIIANSTYSFWGAYLNENKKKRVIVPSRWTKKNNHVLCCPDWYILDV